MKTYLLLLFFLIIYSCNFDKTDSSDKITKVDKGDNEKIIDVLATENKKCNRITIEDTLKIELFADTGYFYSNREGVIIDYLAFKLIDILYKYKNSCFILIDSKNSKKILFNEYYDKEKLRKLNEAYKIPIYKDFIIYMKDSMSTNDFLNYKSMLMAYSIKKDIMVIIFDFMDESTGQLAGNKNRSILEQLCLIYSNPEFKDSPQLKKHLEFFLGYLSDSHSIRT